MIIHSTTWQVGNFILTLYQHNNGFYGIEVRNAQDNLITNTAIRSTIAGCYGYLSEVGIDF